MSVDLGIAQIDMALCDALTAAGVRDNDARELARLNAFGGASIKPWIAGLGAAAALLNRGSINIDAGTLPDPWDSVCGALTSANGTGPGEALAQSVRCYPLEVQSALIAAIGAVAQLQSNEASKIRHVDVSQVPSPNRTAAAQQLATYLQPVDPELVKRIQKLLQKGGRGNKERSRKAAGEHLIDWMTEHGKFILTPLGQRYYLHGDSRRLYALDTDAWHAFLYKLTSCNPAGTDFRYLVADCEAAAEEGERLDVIEVAHWDQEHQLLRVSRFDGNVYRLDGHTIELEANGDGPVLFDDARSWMSYSPDFSADGSVLDWSLNLPHWDADQAEYNLLYRAWWQAIFFTELCPTRPILVLKGEKGSGKTMALRIMLRMMFGPAADVYGLPEKPDAFIAMTSNSHVVVLDNLDTMAKENRDKIASLSTGKLDQVRRLYTTNETQTIQYRCWLAITSRTPDTLQRDDLVDRTLILPVARIEDNDRTRESKFLAEVIAKRNAWWGDVLTTLNSIVADLRREGLPDRGGVRMEDWAALGSAMARANDQDELWEMSLERVKTRQAEFLLEDNVIVQAVETWLVSSQYSHMPQPTRHLYEAAKSALYGVDRPEDAWPRSVKSFGRQLKGLQRELQARLAQIGVRMSWRQLHGETVYEFTKPTVI